MAFSVRKARKLRNAVKFWHATNARFVVSARRPRSETLNIKILDKHLVNGYFERQLVAYARTHDTDWDE